MNEQEKFFRNVLSKVNALYRQADDYRDRADSLEQGAAEIEVAVRNEAERVGIDLSEEF